MRVYFFPFRCWDPPPFFTPGRSEDGILPTPYFSTRLPSPPSVRRLGSFLRCSGSSLRRSGSPQKASSTPVSRSAPSTLGVHSLSFLLSPLPRFLHVLHSCLTSSLRFPGRFLLPPSLFCLRFLRHFTFFKSPQRHWALYHVPCEEINKTRTCTMPTRV